MQMIIGTSGWMYRDWNGKFYPSTVKGKDQLAYYAQHFQTVEINSTFYHLPYASSAPRWYEVVPADFCYTIKCNRFLTHNKKLLIDDESREVMAEFLTLLAPLKEKLAVMLVQLPPSLRFDVKRLEQFTQSLQAEAERQQLQFRIAIEFRHASWFTEETWALMRAHNLAHVIIDSPGRWPAFKQVTADIAYIRFHGSQRLYRSSYTDDELRNWLAYIKEAAGDTRATYCYFNNDYEAVAIANARRMIELAQA